MRKLLLATCLAVGLGLGAVGMNSAQAHDGWGGYRGSGCYYGGGRPSYGVGYAPYGRYYSAPRVAVSRGYPVQSFGTRSFYGGGFPGAYGNLGYPSMNRIGIGFGGGYGNFGYPGFGTPGIGFGRGF